MRELLRRSLEYVKNTNGGATRADFIDDIAPIGDQVWHDMATQGLVREADDGRIYLTEAGEAALAK